LNIFRLMDTDVPTLISIMDTTIADNNLGNEIIMESVCHYLRKIFPNGFFIKLPYLDELGPASINYITQSKFVFFGGGNCLTSDMKKYKQMGIDKRIAREIRDIILMGVGWWQYQEEPTRYTRKVLNNIMHHEYFHSVRDNYTAEKLKSIGFNNVLVTGCPSMWRLNQELCSQIPTNKSDNVLLTFTDYNQSSYDLQILKILEKQYKRIVLWPQGLEDFRYTRQISSSIEVIAPSLEALDNVLRSTLDIDYVGTRLHAGIRALQFKRRTIILSIDNRASEKAKDFNLPSLPRENVERLEAIIEKPLITSINLPEENINKWLSQF